MELEKEHSRDIQVIEKMKSRVNQLQAHVHDFMLQSMQETQVNLLSCKAHKGPSNGASPCHPSTGVTIVHSNSNRVVLFMWP
jgi:hypothetical protein